MVEADDAENGRRSICHHRPLVFIGRGGIAYCMAITGIVIPSRGGLLPPAADSALFCILHFVFVFFERGGLVQMIVSVTVWRVSISMLGSLLALICSLCRVVGKIRCESVI